MKNDFKMILKASKKHFKSLLLKLRFFDKFIIKRETGWKSVGK